jgi:hypothetical protein
MLFDFQVSTDLMSLVLPLTRLTDANPYPLCRSAATPSTRAGSYTKGLRLPTAAAGGNVASALPAGIRDSLRCAVLLAHVRASASELFVIADATVSVALSSFRTFAAHPERPLMCNASRTLVKASCPGRVR